MPNWTKEQSDAINKDGTNIIVSAGAGSGKTAVLSERVLRKLKEGVNVNELLILTFTKAAAKEMKERIRKKIKKEPSLSAQLELIDSAYITTFDSYSLSVLKKYHYLLNLSKNIGITDSTLVQIKKEEILDNIFEELYEEKDEKFEEFISTFCTKDDKEIRNYLLNIYSKLELKTDKKEYLEKYINEYFNEEKIRNDIDLFEKSILKKKEKIEENQDENSEESTTEENTPNENNAILDLIKKDGEENPELIKKAIVPNTQSFIELIQNKVAEGNDIELIQKSPSFLSTIPSYFFSLLPTIIMVALFIMIFKMQGLGDRGEVYDETERKTKVKFSDIAGLDEEKEEMVELVQFLKEPKKFIEMGAKIPKGVLLYGKPGTGKTLIAKAIAGEAGVPFISMSGSEFIEMFAGLGASRVRKLFEKARKLAPCIVFIDEIDAIGSRRTSGSGAESENNQTLNQLLVEMDGFSSEETIIVLAATNRPEMLDKALLRPGRFDRQITIPSPDIRGRLEILKIHAKDKKRQRRNIKNS